MKFMYSHYYKLIDDWLCKEHILLYRNNYTMEFIDHVENMSFTRHKIKNFVFKRCKICKRKKNIKECENCSDCRNYRLIKKTFNIITKILPIEIINYIQLFF